MWVAVDLANVLYPSGGKKGAKKQTWEDIQAAKAAEYKQMQAIWKNVDADGSGLLDWEELRIVMVKTGLGRTVALHHRSSSLHQTR